MTIKTVPNPVQLISFGLMFPCPHCRHAQCVIVQGMKEGFRLGNVETYQCDGCGFPYHVTPILETRERSEGHHITDCTVQVIVERPHLHDYKKLIEKGGGGV